MDTWQEKLAETLTRGDTSALPEMLILLVALIGCSSFALIQFFTMLGTRWGDKNPGPKSFVLSLLVHVIIVLAWSAVDAIRPLAATMDSPGNNRDAIPIREIVDTDPVDNFEEGNTRVWEKMEDLPETELTRQERPLDLPEDMTDAPRTPVDSSTPNLDPVELVDLPVQPAGAESPTQELSSQEMLIQAAPIPSSSGEYESTTAARAEAGTGSPSRRTQRAANPPVESGELPKTRGSGDPAALNQTDDVAMSIPLDLAAEEGNNPVLSGQKSDTIRKGAAATPSSAPDGDYVPDGRTDEIGKPSFSRAKGFGRDKTLRGTGGTGDEELPGRIPGDNPGIPNPNPERMLNPSMKSGEGLPGDSPTPNLQRGGPNLPNRSPATYKYRQWEKRRGTAMKRGGSLESEKAVENSLKWLAKVQERDGYWDADKHGGGAQAKDPQGHARQGGGKLADSGVTGLALLAFMGAGYTPTDGDYADNVDRGLKWLIQQQRDDGYLGGNATHYDQMYCHAIATFALGEACGMQEEADRSPELRRAVRSAVEFIVERQLSDGGWRYEKNSEGDMSMFGWQLMALKSADIAGIKTKPEVWTDMIAFLKKRSLGEHDGLAGYNTNNPKPTTAMTAEALFCKQMIGINRTNPASQEAVGFLLKNLPQSARYDEYYWYYGTLAMFQQGGDAWDQWNAAQRDLLIQLQETRGKNAGSWDPKGKWAGIGGRIYSTALSTMCLEVYYRYLPLYQTNQE